MPKISPARSAARKAYAAEFDRRGGPFRNTADSIRAGFENFWISPALDALEKLVDLQDGDDDLEG